MKYNFDERTHRKETACIKYDIACKDDKDIIPLFLADMDFKTAQPIIDAMHKVADFGMWGYTSTNGEPKYNKAIINWFERRHNVIINKDEIIYSNGTIEALRCIINTFSNVGDGIIICRPVYGHFSSCIENECHRKVADAHLIYDKKNHYWNLDFDEIERECSDCKNRIMIMSNPHNPIGRVWTKEELTKVADICRKHHVILISDEVHCDILRKNFTHNSIYSCVEDVTNIIMLTAINKTFNMAGLSCSNIIIKDKFLRDRFIDAFGEHQPTPFAVYGLIAAYNEGEEWLEQVNEYIDGNIDWTINFIRENLPRVKVDRPEGTYCLWLDFSDYNLSDSEIHKIIYEDAKVLMQDGIVHDPIFGKCCQRVCLPCRRDMIKEAFERIKTEFYKIEK